MRVGVGSDIQKVPFFGEFRVQERVMVGFAVVWDVAVEDIRKDERRRTATYPSSMLATRITELRQAINLL
jgi:hypothetical protein